MRAILLLALGCARAIDAAPTHEVRATEALAEEPAECRIAGAMTLQAGARLFGDRDAPASFAQFNGRTVTVTVRDVPSMVVDRVGLRAATPSGFAVDGWLDRERLQFAARGRIPLAGDVAWIPAGTPVSVKLGVGRQVVVSPATKRLAPIEALVACEDLALGHVPRARPLEETGELYNLVDDRLAVAATRDGPPVFTLRPRNPGTMVVSVEDTGDGMRLRLSDGIAVEGWVDRAALKPITSLSMSGCGGCSGLHFGHVVKLGPVRLATARKSTAVGVGETGPGVRRGTAAKGAELIVLDEVSGYARVVPRCRELVAETSFWVLRGDLDVGSLVGDGGAIDRACR